MKISNIYRICLFFAIFCIHSASFGQGSLALQDNECYVVVGAFNLEKNAITFANSWVSQGYDAQYKYNSHRHLHYVYTYRSTDRESAKSKLFSVRKKHPGMIDSWLYAGNFKESHITSEEWAAMLAVPEESVVKKEITPENVKETITEKKIEVKKSESVIAEEPETFKVYINTTNASNQREVKADFKVIDMERSKELAPVKSHELLRIKPKNGTNRIKFVSNVIGYKLDEYVIDLDEPLLDPNSRVEVTGDTILIDFELAKLGKGDFAVLWQIFFYKDAAIMRKESVYELNQLLLMMRNDEKMRIKIHGHTNGNARGKVLHLNLADKQFFSLNESHREDNTSAKKLSEYRAYTIQHWLVGQGIAEDRMEIIGWGGKKMLHDKHDDKAHKNARVEIEVLGSS